MAVSRILNFSSKFTAFAMAISLNVFAASLTFTDGEIIINVRSFIIEVRTRYRDAESLGF